MNNVVRDLIEIGMLVALGGMLWSVVRRMRRGQIHVVRCEACHRPTSRAYPNCKHCGVPRAETTR